MDIAHINLPVAASPVPSVARHTTGPAGRQRRLSVSDQVLGMVIVAAIPAVIWTLAIFLACRSFDIAITAATLATIGGSITIFLGIVGSALMSRH